MPLTLADVAPLMRGHYVDQTTMWSALERLEAQVIDCALRLAPSGDRRGFAVEVLADLALAISRRAGLAFEGEPPTDYTGWLVLNIRRVALDRLRRLRAEVRADLPQERIEEPTSADEPAATDEAAIHQRTFDVWEKLRASDCPPAYRLALFAWYWPRQLTRDDLVSLSRQVERGKLEQRSGLVRPVEQAWPLSRKLFCHFNDGIQRNGKAQSAFAWIVRSDAPRFSAWAEDRRAERAARETIGKWHVRGRKWLEQRATPDGGAA